MRKADNLPPYCAVVKKARSLNFLDTSGPPMACYGSALPLPLSEKGLLKIEIKSRKHESMRKSRPGRINVKGYTYDNVLCECITYTYSQPNINRLHVHVPVCENIFPAYDSLITLSTGIQI